MTAEPLSHRHALVTGASRGIGAAIVRRLAEMGASVTLVSRSEGPLQELARELQEEHGRPFHAAPADVTESVAVTRAFATAREAGGPIDILVNNAGAVESVPFLKLSDEQWSGIIDINLTSAFHCTRLALPDMVEAGWGRVINLASIAGVTGVPYVAPYVAAKHALVGLTRSLAVEFAGKGVTVNAVCPGYVDTELVSGSVDALAAKTGRSHEELRAALIRNNPSRRMLTVDEVASAVGWLAHPEQAMVNGHALVLSGGEVF
jgi:NAD(P)-dependent dehydrogenase (short-subunit alcohol dehydrogenase family)